MPEGGNLSIQTENKDGSLEITINDTGPGIPQDKLKHIFDPFYTTKEKGTGLGLFIVHQIIQNNKGDVSIESKLGKGTTAKVRFDIN